MAPKTLNLIKKGIKPRISHKTRKKVTTRIESKCAVYDFLVVGAAAPPWNAVVRPLE